MKKRSLHHLITLLILILSSCVTTGVTESGLEDTEKPEWMTLRPPGKDYYIGIGGSQTGNQADDKELARTRALTELSSEIYASIESSLDIMTEDNSRTGETYLVKQNIIQNVEQDLEAIETAGTWYSKKEGYWYYLRLSRADWETIQKKRARDMEKRIGEMFRDIFRDTLSELKAIDRAYTEYQNNYTGRKVRMELFGQEGAIDTLLLIRAEELINGLSIPELPFPPSLPQMEPIVFSGQVSSHTGRNAGSLQLKLYLNEKTLAGEIPTAPDGSFEWLYQVNEEPGEVNYLMVMASPFKNEQLNDQLGYALPRVSASVQIKELMIKLEVISPMGTDQGVYERSFDILDEMTAFGLTDTAAARSLKVEFSYHEAPPNDYGIIISYGRSFVSLVTDNGESVLWQSSEVKTGGLTVDQARGKVADKLLDNMRDDSELKQVLQEISF